MGTLVRFHPRQEGAVARAESVLARLEEHHKANERARFELPGVLAALSRHGESEFALKLLGLWGAAEVSPAELLAMAEQYAAVCGLKEIGNRPLSHRVEGPTR